MFPLDASHIIPFYHDILLRPSIAWLPVLFRFLSAVVIAPVVFFSMLDVTAYLIARTVGLTTSHPSRVHSIPSVPLPPTPPTVDQPGNPTIVISGTSPSKLDRTSPNARSSPSTSSIPSEIRFPHHFTTPSEGANYALSGDGLFSPPESRAGSPTLEKGPILGGGGSALKTKYSTRKRAASVGVEALGVITDDDDDDTTSSGTSGKESEDPAAGGPPAAGRSLRKRNPGLQITPMGS